MSIHQFVKLFCLNYQAYSPTLLVGKLSKLLVIDGNHRITDCIKKNKKTIKAYGINEEFLIDNNLFVSGFDKLIYIMMNEIIAIATYTLQDNVPADILFMQTSLYTGKLLKHNGE